MKSLFSNTKTQESKRCVHAKEKNEMIPTVYSYSLPQFYAWRYFWTMVNIGRCKAGLRRQTLSLGRTRCLEFAISSFRKEELYRKNFRILIKSVPGYYAVHA